MYNTDLPTRAELPSARKLLHSTLVAAVIAGALLTTAVLPAEYGLDPTGIGSALGLKKMGEIKTALAREATEATPARPAPAAVAPAAVVPAPPPQTATAPAKPIASSAQAAARADEVSVTLKPGQGAEVKLDMRKGSKVAYRWATRGGAVNFDTHGDPINPPAGFYHGYGKGRQVDNDEGVLEAAFDGKHGWFWRNRSNADVVVILSTKGEYAAIKRVL